MQDFFLIISAMFVCAVVILILYFSLKNSYERNVTSEEEKRKQAQEAMDRLSEKRKETHKKEMDKIEDEIEKVLVPEGSPHNTSRVKLGTVLKRDPKTGKEEEWSYCLPDAYRHSHFYIIGSTGMGKTKLLYSLISQDINKDDGIRYN